MRNQNKNNFLYNFLSVSKTKQNLISKEKKYAQLRLYRHEINMYSSTRNQYVSCIPLHETNMFRVFLFTKPICFVYSSSRNQYVSCIPLHETNSSSATLRRKLRFRRVKRSTEASLTKIEFRFY